MSVVVSQTPFEQVSVNGWTVFVKREDLCCPLPGPGFSKIRGVAAHIAELPHPVIGVLDTFHSKAGWAVSYVCKELGGRKPVVYWPRFKADPRQGLVRPQQKMAALLGADLVDLPAGRSSVLYHQAKKHLREQWGGADPDRGVYMMPNALKLSESVIETALEVERTPAKLLKGTWIISTSSGTIAAGVLRGLANVGAAPNVILHSGYSRGMDAAMNYMRPKTGASSWRCAPGFLRQYPGWRMDFSPGVSIRGVWVDEGFHYKDRVNFPVEFPCNPYYDLKAWRWLALYSSRLYPQPEELPEPIIFWNIGD